MTTEDLKRLETEIGGWRKSGLSPSWATIDILSNDWRPFTVLCSTKASLASNHYRGYTCIYKSK